MNFGVCDNNKDIIWINNMSIFDNSWNMAFLWVKKIFEDTLKNPTHVLLKITLALDEEKSNSIPAFKVPFAAVWSLIFDTPFNFNFSGGWDLDRYSPLRRTRPGSARANPRLVSRDLGLLFRGIQRSEVHVSMCHRAKHQLCLLCRWHVVAISGLRGRPEGNPGWMWRVPGPSWRPQK